MYSISPSLSLQLANCLLSNARSGYSVNIQGVEPRCGYMVGGIVQPLVYQNTASVNVHEVSSWIKAYINANNSDKNIFFGIWRNPENNQVFIDVSQQISDLDLALEVARNRGEIAIYDIANKCDIRL